MTSAERQQLTTELIKVTRERDKLRQQVQVWKRERDEAVQAVEGWRPVLVRLHAERDTLRGLLARTLVLLPTQHEDEQRLRALITAALDPHHPHITGPQEPQA